MKRELLLTRLTAEGKCRRFLFGLDHMDDGTVRCYSYAQKRFLDIHGEPVTAFEITAKSAERCAYYLWLKTASHKMRCGKVEARIELRNPNSVKVKEIAELIGLLNPKLEIDVEEVCIEGRCAIDDKTERRTTKKLLITRPKSCLKRYVAMPEGFSQCDRDVIGTTGDPNDFPQVKALANFYNQLEGRRGLLWAFGTLTK